MKLLFMSFRKGRRPTTLLGVQTLRAESQGGHLIGVWTRASQGSGVKGRASSSRLSSSALRCWVITSSTPSRAPFLVRPETRDSFCSSFSKMSNRHPNERWDQDEGESGTRLRGPARELPPPSKRSPGDRGEARWVKPGRPGQRLGSRLTNPIGAEAGRWRGGSGRGARAERGGADEGLPACRAALGFRLWAVRGSAAAGSGLTRPLETLPRLPGPRPGL